MSRLRSHSEDQGRLLGRRRLGRNISYRVVIGPPEKKIESDYSHDEDLSWLRQWYVASSALIYLVDDESYPSRIWEGEKNSVESFFKCVWEDELHFPPSRYEQATHVEQPATGNG